MSYSMSSIVHHLIPYDMLYITIPHHLIPHTMLYIPILHHLITHAMLYIYYSTLSNAVIKLGYSLHKPNSHIINHLVTAIWCHFRVNTITSQVPPWHVSSHPRDIIKGCLRRLVPYAIMYIPYSTQPYSICHSIRSLIHIALFHTPCCTISILHCLFPCTMLYIAIPHHLIP